MDKKIVVRMEQITKIFGSVKALDQVDFELRAGREWLGKIHIDQSAWRYT